MIAFLGPNEAGKTTVLRALDWYSNADGALPSKFHSSTRPPSPEESVVEVTYWLNKDDLAVISDLGLAEKPRFYRRGRRANGTFYSALEPKSGEREPGPFDEARERLTAALAAEPEIDPEESEPNLRLHEAVLFELLGDPDAQWSDEWDESFEAALERLDGVGDEETLTALATVREVLTATHPDEAARTRLRKRIPGFALFAEEDRAIRSSYDLSDEALRDDPPSALANLAWVADLDLQSLWEAIDAGDQRKIGTTERRANERLDRRLSTRWSQRDLDVVFNVNGTELQVQIFEDVEDGAVTPVDERSDGLRTFIALVAFLARHDFATPPVLLVDEAETHLHYDAQADLVEVLTKDVQATQVFYTTHSPGCLPRDLGTGIRLVAPVPGTADESRLRNDFWTSDHPGFTPLLFAMGAGAAAFSAFRKAVLTEGAGDMILLPSLLRKAMDKEDLDFQVAPGIANYHGSGLELEEVAARVVYLVDGDGGGDDHAARLLGMGVPAERILQFDPPTAVEDYVHPDRYLGVVNDLLRLSGHTSTLTLGELDHTVSIGKAVELWCESQGVSPPGKTVVAALLIDDQDALILAEGAHEKLKALHAKIRRALTAQPKGRAR
ncbi:AAA family ATPase [Nocardioides baculatus]|uniref:AAA family ATPase n=1 Tax=Nocardioides baculatus TaxID=2801337 RepID=A0ABS1LCQ0_9ACTN|nr:AAA family ATPase [Nocardioides baculatus]MBL0749476.1 AAA family ATPase [Nocardioides baculatus]